MNIRLLGGLLLELLNVALMLACVFTLMIDHWKLMIICSVFGFCVTFFLCIHAENTIGVFNEIRIFVDFMLMKYSG